MATDPKVHVDIHSNFLAASPESTNELASTVSKALIAQAKQGEVSVTVNNIAGRPFQVVTHPGGKVAWGVGGSVGAPSAGAAVE